MQWVAKTGRVVATHDEMNERALRFAEKIKTIDAHNKLYAEGSESYGKGLNQFSDMTAAEIDDILHPKNFDEGIFKGATPAPPLARKADDEVMKQSSGEVSKGAWISRDL